MNVAEPLHWPDVHENEHIMPFPQVTTQSSQAPPAMPHTVIVLPAWHVVPLQQPPLQIDVVLQVVEHFPPLQALSGSQSPAVEQPHTPPVTHLAPFMPAQVAQEPPAVPHAPLLVPETHWVPSQHPPLHCPGPLQVVVHLLVLHA